MKKNVAVIGLGIFGYETAIRLTETGCTVMAMDSDRKKVDRIKDDVAAAVIANVTDVEALEELGIDGFDMIILGMGSSFEQMVLGITYLKKLGAKHVISRANTTVQKEILQKIGADTVILPEEDAAHRLAQQIVQPNVTGLFKVDEGVSIAEVTVGHNFAGKTLIEMDLRRKYGLTVLLMKRKGGKAQVITDPNMTVDEGDVLVIAGEHDNIVKTFSK